MRIKKNLTLSQEAIRAGEKLAAAANTSLSRIVEQRLLGPGESKEDLSADYWSKPTSPSKRPGDARYEFLKDKQT